MVFLNLKGVRSYKISVSLDQMTKYLGHKGNKSLRNIFIPHVRPHEKNSRIHLDRLQNKCANCKGVKNNTNFRPITGIQEKLDKTCK